MTAARDKFRTELEAHLPASYTVHPYAKQLDGVEGPVILVALGGITREPVGGARTRRYAAKVLAVAPVADTDLATTEEVDALAEDVLAALDDSSLDWTTAERVSVDDTWSGWEVQASVLLSITHP